MVKRRVTPKGVEPTAGKSSRLVRRKGGRVIGTLRKKDYRKRSLAREIRKKEKSAKRAKTLGGRNIEDSIVGRGAKRAKRIAGLKVSVNRLKNKPRKK